MSYGLTTDETSTIVRIFAKYPEIREVWLFGSRALLKFQAGSDVDLAIMNSGVSGRIIRNVLSDFEDSNLPYFVDIINFPELKHTDIKNHIMQAGKLLYKSESLSLLNERESDYKQDEVKP